MPEASHPGLAGGRWHDLSLVEQLGNIGSDVSRALAARSAGRRERMFQAVDRALELFDLTLADPKHRGRLKEICRAREVVADFFYGDNAYGTDPAGASLDRYFRAYAVAARIRAGRA
jgi:hypothetical protein